MARCVFPLFNLTKLLRNPFPGNIMSFDLVRHAAKKTSSATRNRRGQRRPKHRGVRVQDGGYVTRGTILATQLHTRFHPGLHVGIGRNGTLYAMEPGKVAITCEKIDPDWSHSYIQQNYGGREGHAIYKKHFNIITSPQGQGFKLVDMV